MNEVLTRVLLVRHGEAQSAVDQIVGGEKGCTGLSDRGRRQCEALRDRWLAVGMTPDVLLASVLPRAIQTAEIIAPVLGNPPIVTHCDLCELHPGECDGMTWAEANRLYGGMFMEDDDRPFSPGGESRSEFFERVEGALDRIVDHFAGKTVVVATHGGVIGNSIVSKMGLPLRFWEQGFEMYTENTSLTEWVHTRPPDGSPTWRLLRYSDAAHLEGLAR